MREEMRDEEESLTVQHTHDYFVISACKISAKLKDSGKESIFISKSPFILEVYFKNFQINFTNRQNQPAKR